MGPVQCCRAATEDPVTTFDSGGRTIMEQRTGQSSRRDFLGKAAAAGAAVALAPHLDAAKNQKNELRTLFFNFSHEDHEGHTYYLVMGKERHLLQPAGPDHPALLWASQKNRLLQSIPAGSITHVLENITAPSNQVLLTYTIKDPDTTTGRWALSSMYLLTPSSSSRYAYEQGSKGLRQGAPLPLSAKRMKYGLPAAVTLQDVFDEQDLVDSTDWA